MHCIAGTPYIRASLDPNACVYVQIGLRSTLHLPPRQRPAVPRARAHPRRFSAMRSIDASPMPVNARSSRLRSTLRQSDRMPYPTKATRASATKRPSASPTCAIWNTRHWCPQQSCRVSGRGSAPPSRARKGGVHCNPVPTVSPAPERRRWRSLNQNLGGQSG